MRLEVDIEAIKAGRRFNASSADMERFVELVRKVGGINNADVTAKGTFDTASGHTEVTVSKRPYATVIVIAIVIAVVFLILFSR